VNPLVNGSFKKYFGGGEEEGKKLAILSKLINVGDCNTFRQMIES
jgi:hypothetical protein